MVHHAKHERTSPACQPPPAVSAPSRKVQRESPRRPMKESPPACRCKEERRCRLLQPGIQRPVPIEIKSLAALIGSANRARRRVDHRPNNSRKQRRGSFAAESTSFAFARLDSASQTLKDAPHPPVTNPLLRRHTEDDQHAHRASLPEDLRFEIHSSGSHYEQTRTQLRCGRLY